jgi:hypothetical protein
MLSPMTTVSGRRVAAAASGMGLSEPPHAVNSSAAKASAVIFASLFMAGENEKARTERAGGGMDAIWRVFDPIMLGWLCALVVLSLLDHWRGRK